MTLPMAIVLGCALLAVSVVVIRYAPPRQHPPQVSVAPAEQQDGEALQDEVDGPQPMDPANPPHYVYYRPVTYDAASAPKCTCHGRPLGYGMKALLWPIPGHPEGGMDVFCPETYGAVQ